MDLLTKCYNFSHYPYFNQICEVLLLDTHCSRTIHQLTLLSKVIFGHGICSG